jgi:hypothetical protein
LIYDHFGHNGKKRKSGATTYRRELDVGKNGGFYKWRDIGSDRGGEEVIENRILQLVQVALNLLSSCSFSAIEYS